MGQINALMPDMLAEGFYSSVGADTINGLNRGASAPIQSAIYEDKLLPSAPEKIVDQRLLADLDVQRGRRSAN